MPGSTRTLLDGRFNNRVAFTIADINRDNYDPTVRHRADLLRRAAAASATNIRATVQPIDAVRLVVGAEHENSRYQRRQRCSRSRGIDQRLRRGDRQAGRAC